MARRDPELDAVARAIPLLVAKSISANTLRSYNQGLKTWRRWSSRVGVNWLPVDRLHLSAFVTSVVQQGGKFGKVELVFFALNWLHNVLDLSNPCSCEETSQASYGEEMPHHHVINANWSVGSV